MTIDDIMYYALAGEDMTVALMADERDFETVWEGEYRDCPFALQEIEIDSWEILGTQKIGFNFTINDNFDSEEEFEEALMED